MLVITHSKKHSSIEKFTVWNCPFLSFRQLFLILPIVAECNLLSPIGPEHTPIGLSTHIALTVPLIPLCGQHRERKRRVLIEWHRQRGVAEVGMTESPVLSSLSMKICIFFPSLSISLLYYKTVELEKRIKICAIRGRSWLREICEGNQKVQIARYK